MNKNKINTIIYDIETSYTVAAVWGLYDQNVAKVIREPFIISISWKYLGENKTYFKSIKDFKSYNKDKFTDKELVKFIKNEIVDKGDIFIGHNSNNFDWKWINGRFAVHGIKPPEPKKHIDTLLIARSKFNFNSNKLKDLLKYFKLPEKLDTGGIDLWYNCIELNDKESWKLMEKYNKQDVISLEKLYLHILPFITNHPNLALLKGELEVCPNCGSNKLQRRGFAYTRVSKSQRIQCLGCGAWHQQPIKGGQVR